MNIVVLQGTLSSEPRERTLPSGAVIANWEVTTRDDGTTRTVPVHWNSVSSRIRGFEEGDEVVVLGAVRRRYFRAGGATASRTEVVAELAARPRQRSAVERLMRRAASTIAA